MTRRWGMAELAIAWHNLGRWDLTRAEQAELLDTTPTALWSAISRARKAGYQIGPDDDYILDEWAHLRDVGDETPERAAKRLHLPYAHFRRVLVDAHRRGDYRGSLIPQDPRRSA